MSGLWLMKICGFVLCILLAGCSQEDTANQVSFRADFVPLKVYMTDYVMKDGGEKLVKIEGSAQLIVPVSIDDPKREGNCFVYESLPRPVVDVQSVRIDRQVLVQNGRGWFESLPENVKTFNEIREEAKQSMIKIVGSKVHVQMAMTSTADALRQFYEKFGYRCEIRKWEKAYEIDDEIK